MRQQFGSFTASELYCPACKSSQPVREELLLVLPSGEIYHLRCKRCSSSLGQRTVSAPSSPASLKNARAQRTSSSRRLLI